MPKVSALIPVYNAGPFVAETLASLKRQSYQDWEAIIVDDGSTDDSLQVIQAEIRGDVRFHLISRENRGVVASLNEAIAMARGEYITRQDADDIAMPDRFAKEVAFLDANPVVALVGAQCQEIDTNGRLLNNGRFTVLPTDSAEIRRRMLLNCITVSSTAMFRRSVLKCVGNFRSCLAPAEDYDMWLRINDAHEVVNLKESLALYRVHHQSLSRSQAPRQALHAEVARLCAIRRRAGETDPVGDGLELTEEMFKILKIDSEAIRRIKFKMVRTNTSQCIERRVHQSAVQLLAECRKLATADVHEQIELDVLGRRLALLERKYWSALNPVVRPAFAWHYFRLLWGKLIRQLKRRILN